MLQRMAFRLAYGLLCILLSGGCALWPRAPVPPLEVGNIEFDPPTIHTIGLSLPVRQGDPSHAPVAKVFYRPAGEHSWKEGLPLQHVRTDTLPRPVPPPFPVADQFAGSVFDLQPDSAYDIKLEVVDPRAAGTLVRVGTVRTRPLPPEDPAVPHPVRIASDAALAFALSRANPGDVIELGAGTYRGPIQVNRSGTAGHPIVLRGSHRDGTIIEAPEAEQAMSVTGAHIIIEHLTLRRSAWGMRIRNTHDVVVRHMRMSGVRYGIDATGGSNRNFYICDNMLSGTGVAWPDTSSRTWNVEGIVVSGTGHVVCHNTLSGFGDALGLSHESDIPNRAIDIFGNDVLWGGDDGIELDFSERNVRAFRNRIGNVGMGISFQPIWGGPAYAFRNVIYNTANAPYKLNQDPSGFHLFHNTAIRPGWAWVQHGAYVSNFSFLNNVTVGTENAVNVIPVIRAGRIDYNGWMPDGEFVFTDRWTGFSAMREKSPYERHGVLLHPPVFQAPVPIPSRFSAFMRPPSAVSLHPESNAVDAGLRLANINDVYTGRAPDLGAVERGLEAPHYGVREYPACVVQTGGARPGPRALISSCVDPDRP